ncbi:hypothetical protein [Noviluteimonas dokdonensis]|nr:hypothetical protein [Lysobacter dokdonensis]
MALLCTGGTAFAADTTEVVMDSRYSSDGGFLPAVNAARDAAAGYALSRAMLTNVLAKHCSGVDIAHALRADEARNRWWQHNSDTVGAAKAYVQLQRAIVQVKQGEAAGTQYRDGVMAQAKADAIATMESWFPEGEQDGATCDKVVDEYFAGTRDINRSEEFGTVLGRLEGDMQAYKDAQRTE